MAPGSLGLLLSLSLLLCCCCCCYSSSSSSCCCCSCSKLFNRDGGDSGGGGIGEVEGGGDEEDVVVDDDNSSVASLVARCIFSIRSCRSFFSMSFINIALIRSFGHLLAESHHAPRPPGRSIVLLQERTMRSLTFFLPFPSSFCVDFPVHAALVTRLSVFLSPGWRTVV